MRKDDAIIQAKQFRVEADALLQKMKLHKTELTRKVEPIRPEEIEHGITMATQPDDIGETIAQHTLAIRDLESAIMRLGMSLKYIGNPTPYPNSYDTSNTVVDKTADGLTL